MSLYVSKNVLKNMYFFLYFDFGVKCDIFLKRFLEIYLSGTEPPYFLIQLYTKHLLSSGGMFELVSGANFFGEIIEWCGYAVASWSFPAFSFALFTICSIGPRAYHHHRCSNNSKTFFLNPVSALRWHTQMWRLFQNAAF